MKKILFVIPSLELGGAEKNLIQLLNQISPKEYQVDLLAFNASGALRSDIPLYVNVLPPNKDIEFFLSGWGKKLFYVRPYSLLCRLRYMYVKHREKTQDAYQKQQIQWTYTFQRCVERLDKNYDIAVSALQGLSSYYVIDKVNSKEKYLWMHTDYALLKGNISFDREYFAQASKIITISPQCKASLVKSFPDWENKICIVENLIESTKILKLANQFYPPEYETHKDYIIVSVGRLRKEKEYFRAVQAAGILKRYGFSFRWFVVGDGELESQLLKMIRKHKLTKEFILLGARKNPYPYIKHADLLVQTSSREGKSFVIKEAEILGTPTLCTSYPTVREQSPTYQTGFEPMEIAKTIATIMEKH